MSQDTVLAIAISGAGALLGLLVVVREVRGPRHARATEYAAFHEGPLTAAVIGEGLGWCGECTGHRWGDIHDDSSHTCATCRTHTITEDTR